MSSPLCHSQEHQRHFQLFIAEETSPGFAFSTTHHNPSSHQHQAANLWTAKQDQHLGRYQEAPGAGQEKPLGQVSSPPARLAHTQESGTAAAAPGAGASPTVQEEQTAWPIHSSIPSALSLAGTSAHNRPLSSQSSLHTLQLLKVALGTTVQGKTSEKQSKFVYFGPLAAIYGWPLQFPW